jgi:hypothetical protein
MGYNFSVSGYYTVKEDKNYPWPCKSEPYRTYMVYTDDIFMKTADGSYNKQNGLGTCGHILPDEDVIFHDKKLNMRML